MQTSLEQVNGAHCDKSLFRISDSVYMCVCVCVCIYIYICLCMYICVYMCINSIGVVLVPLIQLGPGVAGLVLVAVLIMLLVVVLSGDGGGRKPF